MHFDNVDMLQPYLACSCGLGIVSLDKIQHGKDFKVWVLWQGLLCADVVAQGAVLKSLLQCSC